MLKRPIKALFVAVVICVGITLWWGCSQPDDIMLEKTQTVLYLDAERLPTNPDGMIYELWVVDESSSEGLSGGHSIEQFGYDFATGTYYDASGAVREESNRFVIDDDIYNYAVLAVTVQRTDGTDDDMGPVMLMDTIQDVWYDPIILSFPHSTGDTSGSAVTYYHMMVTSDIGSQPTEYQGSALWFNSVYRDSSEIEDTLSIQDFTIDTVYLDTLGDDAMRTSVTNIYNIRPDTIYRHFGLDSMQQVRVLYDPEEHIAYANSPDSIDPNTNKAYWLTTRLEIDFETANYRPIIYFDHIQIAQMLYDMSAYGWKYEGWVLASSVGQASLGTFTRPAWLSYNNPYDSLIHGIDGGLISTGRFTDVFLPDESNPYSLNNHVPPYPGEDFLQNLPNAATAPLTLVPDNNGPHGTVFISLEPNNRVSGTTNFPLIAMIAALPDSINQVQNDTQSFAMTNMFKQVESDLTGMPRIKVEIERY
ncbi:MAG TPA: anti-sigma factor [candidate division Zixibacteria bacterium]|nr:anti-sigma factor [candidate division Zixibacteria bacterium]